MLESVQRFKREGRFAEINAGIPYAGFLGLESCEEDGRLVTVLRRAEHNVGNTFVPMIHGGAVGALLEHAAILQLLWELDLARLPKIVNISIDYLRPCLLEDTCAGGVIVRQGRRVANVRVEAWQGERGRAVAAAHAHFLLAGG